MGIFISMTIKTLNQFLAETTVPEHLHYRVEYWDHHSEVDKDTHEKIHEAMNGGTHVHFPLEAAGSNADPDVVEHLMNHGYRINDYQKGIVSKKKTVGNGKDIPFREKYVEEKIGSVLDKTGATDNVKKSFMNDPNRSSSKSKDSLHVVIGTSPLAIAGMSTGTNWTSCMGMDRSGRAGLVDNSHYLQHDSEHGTHVAYLVKGDDHNAFKYGEPDKPIARISLQPFHYENGSDKDTIFRDNGSMYGNGNTSFQHAVRQWAIKNYPARSGEVYDKNRNMYGEGDSTYQEHSYDDIKDVIDSGSKFPSTMTPENVETAVQHIKDRYTDHGEKSIFARELNMDCSKFNCSSCPETVSIECKTWNQ